MIHRAKIESEAVDVLKKTNCYQVPISLENVAENLGIEIEGLPLGEGVSGVLVIEEGKGHIGFNSNHAPVRQRFTIAHEIGHFWLHAKNRDLFSVDDNQKLFIDNNDNFKVYLRDSKSESGENNAEVEANRFAAAILMPKELVENEISKLSGLDLSDEKDMARLAAIFKVSNQAMTIRLGTLGLLDQSL
jgi:Zn-dependent peptidase ImmA (M78 family)